MPSGETRPVLCKSGPLPFRTQAPDALQAVKLPQSHLPVRHGREILCDLHLAVKQGGAFSLRKEARGLPCRSGRRGEVQKCLLSREGRAAAACHGVAWTQRWGCFRSVASRDS